MRSLEQDLIAWEISEEPDDWQKQQYETWQRDKELRLKFADFYCFLKERRRHEVEEKKKRAALGSRVVNTSRTVQGKYLTTVKEVEMSTSEPTLEQRQGMELIKEWNASTKLQSMYRTFDRFLAAMETKKEMDRREARRQWARGQRLNEVVRRAEPRLLTEREQVYLERVNRTNPLR